jgi:predicted HicB family RNase H-like nuclease
MEEREKRDARVLLRVHPDEHEAWTREAKRAGLTLSAWLRTLANGAVRRAAAKRKAAKK